MYNLEHPSYLPSTPLAGLPTTMQSPAGTSPLSISISYNYTVLIPFNYKDLE